MSPDSQSPPLPASPKRTVHHADALGWLREQARLTNASVITSLPDVSELSGLSFPQWQEWFVEAAALVMSTVPEEGVAIFFQSDIKHAGRWIDKGALVQRASEVAAMHLLFHKIVCRKPAGTASFGRATYSHMLGFARVLRPARCPLVHVLPDAGFRPGVKSMGVNACLDACRFVLSETTTRTIVDPFCGFGTVLAVANALGMDAVGVDLSVRMCRSARQLKVDLSSTD